VFEVPPNELQPVSKLIHEEMCRSLTDRLQVQLKVDVSAGPNWLDLDPVPGLEGYNG
jgi:DNA polymerase I